MSTRSDFDSVLAAWLEAGPTDVPAYVVVDALRQARSTRQPRGPLPGLGRALMNPLYVQVPTALRSLWLRFVIVTGLLILVLVGAALYVGSRPKLPDQFRLPTPGLIAFDSDGSIVVANADGTQPRTLATGTPDLSPTFSPDGRWIAFWARNRFVSDSTVRLMVMTMNGTSQHFAGGRFSYEQWNLDHAFPLPAIGWAPDSGRLAYSASDATARAAAEQRIYVVERDQAYTQDLVQGWQATDPIGDPNLDARDPAWSFDGTHIAFHGKGTAIGDGAGVYVMNADGTGVHRVSRSGGNEFAFLRPQWQPGGDRIAYYAGDPAATDGQHDIYVASADGAAEERLTTNPADEFFPVWSPDGTRLAFDRVVDDDTAQVVIIDADGGHAVVSARLPLDGAPPVWAPDGKSVYVLTGSPTGRSGAVRLSATDLTQNGSIDIVKSAGDVTWQRVWP
jgi:Tol biopolymer transport system component